MKAEAPLRTQLVSDAQRGGMVMQLLGEAGAGVLAEVFRSDKTHVLTLCTFGNSLPLPVVTRFIEEAADGLTPFEDTLSFPRDLT